MLQEAKSPFGDCGGNITDTENGVIKSPHYPQKYSTTDKSKYLKRQCERERPFHIVFSIYVKNEDIFSSEVSLGAVSNAFIHSAD